MAAPDFDGRVRRLGPPGAPSAFEPAPRRRAIFDAPLSISRDEHGSGANGTSGSGHFDASRGDNIMSVEGSSTLSKNFPNRQTYLSTAAD